MYRISYRFLVPGWSAKPLVSAHDRIMGTHTHEPINRAEMATYLRNLVRAASPDLFDSDGELEGVETLDQFDDARQTTTAATSDAIAEVYELGVTIGRTGASPRPEGQQCRPVGASPMPEQATLRAEPPTECGLTRIRAAQAPSCTPT